MTFPTRAELEASSGVDGRSVRRIQHVRHRHLVDVGHIHRPGLLERVDPPARRRGASPLAVACREGPRPPRGDRPRDDRRRPRQRDGGLPMVGASGIDTSAWGPSVLAVIGEAWINLYLSLVVWGVLGLVIAVLTRSAVGAVAIGIGYVLGLESLIKMTVSAAPSDLLLGTTLNAIASGGTAAVSFGERLPCARWRVCHRGPRPRGDGVFARRDVTDWGGRDRVTQRGGDRGGGGRARSSSKRRSQSSLRAGMRAHPPVPSLRRRGRRGGDDLPTLPGQDRPVLRRGARAQCRHARVGGWPPGTGRDEGTVEENLVNALSRLAELQEGEYRSKWPSRQTQSLPPCVVARWVLSAPRSRRATRGDHRLSGRRTGPRAGPPRH